MITKKLTKTRPKRLFSRSVKTGWWY